MWKLAQLPILNQYLAQTMQSPRRATSRYCWKIYRTFNKMCRRACHAYEKIGTDCSLPFVKWSRVNNTEIHWPNNNFWHYSESNTNDDGGTGETKGDRFRSLYSRVTVKNYHLPEGRAGIPTWNIFPSLPGIRKEESCTSIFIWRITFSSINAISPSKNS